MWAQKPAQDLSTVPTQGDPVPAGPDGSHSLFQFMLRLSIGLIFFFLKTFCIGVQLIYNTMLCLFQAYNKVN